MTDAQPYALFAARLRELRHAHQWTINEAAARLSALSGDPVSHSTWASWEAGLRFPRAELTQRLAALFSVIDGELERLVEQALPAPGN